MSNIKYSGGMYQPDIKNIYLETLPQKSRPNAHTRFLASYAIEAFLNKDLFEFNEADLSLLFEMLKPKTLTSARNALHYWSNYILWAKEKGYSTLDLGYLENITDNWLEYFIEGSFITEEQLSEIENSCVNSQDKVILRLIFEGVSGKGWSEVRNLKKQDVDFKNKKLTLTDDNNTRELPVSDRCLELITGALQQERYLKDNGRLIGNHNSPDALIIITDYVVRMNKTNIQTPDDNNRPIDKNIINRRVKSVSQMSPNQIQKSGMLKISRNFMEKHGLLSSELFSKLCIIYNKTDSIPQHYVLKSFVNLDNIEKIYNINYFPKYPEWWNESQENGLFGEKIIFKYLKSIYKDKRVEKVPDKAGYDFEVELYKKDKMRIEVKTIQSKRNPFYMTINELVTAEKHSDEYYIYLVLNSDNESIMVYIINNPIKYLNINLQDVLKTSNNEFCTIETKTIRIQLSSSFFDIHYPILVEHP